MTLAARMGCANCMAMQYELSNKKTKIESLRQKLAEKEKLYQQQSVILNNRFDQQDTIDELRAQLEEKDEELLKVVRRNFGQICSYCGKGNDDDMTWDELQDHINNCKNHPLYQQRKRAEQAEAQLARCVEKLEDLVVYTGAIKKRAGLRMSDPNTGALNYAQTFLDSLPDSAKQDAEILRCAKAWVSLFDSTIFKMCNAESGHKYLPEVKALIEAVRVKENK